MSKEEVEGRLAAIPAADVAGYSRLIDADEEGAFTALRAHWREFLDLNIAERRRQLPRTRMRAAAFSKLISKEDV
jgi:adenylate cyclase